MESTLSLAKKDLEAKIGFYLGYGRGAQFSETAWTTEQQNSITEVLESGLRQFYFPPPVNNVNYDWTFLKPVAELALTSGQAILEMPDDFAGIEDDVFVADSDQQTFPMRIIGIGNVLQKYSLIPDATGRPEVAAVRPKKMLDRRHGQRSELYVYPAADADYTLSVQYYLLPQALDGSREYAYGGMAHAETILESCLAIAEQRLDDKAGIHTMKFMERLAASINHDRRLKQQHFGYNDDRSDSRDGLHRTMWMDQTVTLAGQAPD